jgi:hypothetical protein
MVKTKVDKNMSDKRVALICFLVGSLLGAAGVFPLVFGAIQAR